MGCSDAVRATPAPSARRSTSPVALLHMTTGMEMSPASWLPIGMRNMPPSWLAMMTPAAPASKALRALSTNVHVPRVTTT